MDLHESGLFGGHLGRLAPEYRAPEGAGVSHTLPEAPLLSLYGKRCISISHTVCIPLFGAIRELAGEVMFTGPASE